jgi:hypothetical protein
VIPRRLASSSRGFMTWGSSGAAFSVFEDMFQERLRTGLLVWFEGGLAVTDFDFLRRGNLSGPILIEEGSLFDLTSPNILISAISGVSEGSGGGGKGWGMVVGDSVHEVGATMIPACAAPCWLDWGITVTMPPALDEYTVDNEGW